MNMVSILTNTIVDLVVIIFGFLPRQPIFDAAQNYLMLIGALTAMPFVVGGFVLGFSQKRLLEEFGTSSEVILDENGEEFIPRKANEDDDTDIEDYGDYGLEDDDDEVVSEEDEGGAGGEE
jgi:hypothetical protein